MCIKMLERDPMTAIRECEGLRLLPADMPEQERKGWGYFCLRKDNNGRSFSGRQTGDRCEGITTDWHPNQAA